jgi:hypothetical protein
LFLFANIVFQAPLLSIVTPIRYNHERGVQGGNNMRLLISTSLMIAAAVIGTERACGQAQPQAPTTVQLPTFRFFTVQTSVSVPDSGGAYLGGINRARDGSASRGFLPWRNRGFGMERGGGHATVHATIIDHDELDKALLAKAAKHGEAAAIDAKAEAIASHVGHSDTDVPAWKPGSGVLRPEPLAGSVAVIRAQNAAAADARAAELAVHFAKAQSAEAEGKPVVAKHYYGIVARRAAGDLKQQALDRIAALKAEAESVPQR